MAAAPTIPIQLLINFTHARDLLCLMASANAPTSPIEVQLKSTVASDLLYVMMSHRLTKSETSMRRMFDTWRNKLDLHIAYGIKSLAMILAPIGRMLPAAADQSRHVTEMAHKSERLR